VTLPASSADGVPFERHVIKRRPGRREAEFIGRTRLVAGRRVVEAGWIIKTVSPSRARQLVAHYKILAAALAGDENSGLPQVPELIDHSVSEGWLALTAFPGIALSALAESATRSGALRTSATALARLERAEAMHAHWPNRRWSVADEATRLAELALQTGRAMPPFADELLVALAEGERATGCAPAHRDLNEEQIIASSASTDGSARRIPPARWIDWDEAAIAPVGLDLGNLLAHEGLRALRSGQRASDVAGILNAYLEAGGRAAPRLVAHWEAVACLRLALLARRAVRDDEGERNPEWVPVPSRDPGESERRSLALEAMARALASR
jgi:hypothetical protein